MHEAGLAAAVAQALRHEGLVGSDGPRIRLLVSGGHGEPEAFDAALRLHLSASVPELELDRVVIVHGPVTRLCADCTATYRSVDPSAPCPVCGGPGIAMPAAERVEIEWGDGR